MLKIEQLAGENSELRSQTTELQKHVSLNLDLLSPATVFHTGKSLPQQQNFDLLSPGYFIHRNNSADNGFETDRFDAKIQNSFKELQRIQEESAQIKQQNNDYKKRIQNLERTVAQLEEEIELNGREKKILKDQLNGKERKIKDVQIEAEQRLEISTADFRKQIDFLKGQQTTLIGQINEQDTRLRNSSCVNRPSLNHSSVVLQHKEDTDGLLLKIAYLEVSL